MRRYNTSWLQPADCTELPAGDGLRRLVYRTQRWDTDFAAHVRRLRERKPVIITGDFNCAHKVCARLGVCLACNSIHGAACSGMTFCCTVPGKWWGPPCGIHLMQEIDIHEPKRNLRSAGFTEVIGLVD